MSEFSCEHCGRSETRQAEVKCDVCGCAMCFSCEQESDASQGGCPKKDIPFSASDIGRVGVDDGGMRFMVLRHHDRCSDGDPIPNIAVLPGTRVRLPGTILHHSWVDLPIRWEET